MTYVPYEWYEINLYDHNHDPYMFLRGWDRFEYTQRLRNPWNHMVEFRMSRTDPRADQLRAVEEFFFITAHRTDPVTGIRNLVYEGFHKTLVDQLQQNGDLILTMYGDGYTSLLRQRAVLPPTGLEHNEKTGTSEGIMKAYVSDCFITCEVARQLPGLLIELNQGNGLPTASYKARYTKLDSVVDAIAREAGLDYGIVGGDTIGTFIFRCVPLWGIDRRSPNTAGNKPLVFDVALGNMTIPIFSTNHSDERNVVYVGGAGQGVDRLVLQFQNTASLLRTPLSRYEAFVDSRQGETDDQLALTGMAYLDKYKVKKSFDFDIRQTDLTRWLRDWGLGDMVTAIYFDNVFDRKVDEITIQVTAGSSAKSVETIRVVLVDPYEQQIDL